MKSFVEIRVRFRKQLLQLQAYAKAAYEAATQGKPPQHFSPDKNGWSGNPLEADQLGKAFDRKEHTEDVQQAIGSAANSGTVGDLVASALQGDYLACQERAYRLLHLTRVRATLHAASRHYGHGHDAGLFLRGVLGTAEDVVRKAKDFQT